MVEHRTVEAVSVEADVKKLVRDVFEPIVLHVIDEPAIVDVFTWKLLTVLTAPRYGVEIANTVRVDAINILLVEIVEPYSEEYIILVAWMVEPCIVDVFV